MTLLRTALLAGTGAYAVNRLTNRSPQPSSSNHRELEPRRTSPQPQEQYQYHQQAYYPPPPPPPPQGYQQCYDHSRAMNQSAPYGHWYPATGPAMQPSPPPQGHQQYYDHSRAMNQSAPYGHWYPATAPARQPSPPPYSTEQYSKDLKEQQAWAEKGQQASAENKGQKLVGSASERA